MPLDHFKWLAPLYDRVISGSATQESILTYAKLPTSGYLLDVGGGTGRVAFNLREQAKKVIIADLSLRMLFQASLKGGLQPTCSRSEWLPFPNGFFDRIIMVDTLHHVNDQKQTARELWRVLKRDGRIVIHEPDIRNIRVKIIALGEKLLLMNSHFISPPRIVDLFSFASTRVKTYEDSYHSWIVIQKT